MTLDYDLVDDDRSFDDVTEGWLEELAGHRLDDAIVRLRYRITGEQQRRIDGGALRRALADAGAAVVKIQPDIVRADRARVEGVDESLSELEALEAWLAADGVEEPLAGRMRERTRGYIEAAA